jgi:tRNA threonylcarbamoyladenosine modification (KEOPS) complex  Pcc1 subunit
MGKSMITKKSIFVIKSPLRASAIYTALRPETRASYEKRAKTTITVKNKQLEIVSKGPHLPYVNASQQSYGKMVEYLDQLNV